MKDHRDHKRRRRDNIERVPVRSEADRPPPAAAVIFGLIPVLEALRSAGRRIDKVWLAEGARPHRLSEIVAICRELGIRVERVPASAFTKHIGAAANHQGVMALVSAAEYAPVDAITAPTDEPHLVVVLDGVEDPRNLGAILRVADCAGANGVVITERRSVGLTETVARSSAGAIEHTKVAKVGNLNRFIEELKAAGIWVVGASGDAAMSYTEWDWTRPSALVLGAEGSGLRRLVAENCDVLVKIPMYGKIDSLNVSVAAGVILFEARRQREDRR